MLPVVDGIERRRTAPAFSWLVIKAQSGSLESLSVRSSSRYNRVGLRIKERKEYRTRLLFYSEHTYCQAASEPNNQLVSVLLWHDQVASDRTAIQSDRSVLLVMDLMRIFLNLEHEK